MKTFGANFLAAYSGLLTLVLAVTVWFQFHPRAQKETLDELSVHRINVVEPDGTLRMVISNHAKLPGIIVHGKEHPFDRPQAGVLFYNDEGSENGGLIFGGHRNSKGEIVDAGGSLSFDKYGANQIVQLLGVDDKEDKLAGLSVTDSPSGSDTRRRIWLGRAEDGMAQLVLMDGKGKKRVRLGVTADGTASLSFLDDQGKVISQIPSTGK